VAVVLVATGDLDPATADGLSELLIGAVAARGGLTIVGKEELQAQLGQGDEGTLECLGSMACLGRLGVQLDVEAIIAGTLARRGDTWAFNLDRVDVRSGRAAGRVFREVDGDLGAVADALSAAVPELYEPPEQPAALVLSSVPGAEVSLDGVVVGVVDRAPLRHEGIAPGEHTVDVARAGRRPWRRRVRFAPGAELHLDAPLSATGVERRESIHPLVWVGAGLSAGALAAGIALGVASQETFDPSREARLNGDVTRAEVLGFYDARTREAVAADILFGVAGAAALAAVVSLFFPVVELAPDDEGVALAPGPGGLALQGRFR
ncbi:MAG TPA: PEGA domain-containing protein, partial [Sandaracinaceae bacterium LLY-WYZ-13_1]|nr:PEGA domain-containing protein [Sandaracinaceae bacterium LLY-WYZ-13_1]